MFLEDEDVDRWVYDPEGDYHRLLAHHAYDLHNQAALEQLQSDQSWATHPWNKWRDR